jgi:LysM repeat protein
VKPQKFTRVFVFALLIVALLGLPAPPALAQAQAQQTPCGPTYTVQRGDTLFGISQACDVSIAALLAANPQITNPRLIYAGQRITIPGGLMVPVTGGQIASPFYVIKPGDNLDYLADRFNTTPEAFVEANPELREDRTLRLDQIITLPGRAFDRPAVMVAPSVGPPGTPVRVAAGGFPADALVEIGAGAPGTHYIILAQVRADSDGRLNAQVNVPLNAPLNQRWVFVANQRDRAGVDAVSNFFYIASRTETQGEFEYLIRPGDTLSHIARRFGMTVSDILDANPQVTNPRRIIAGQWLIIPGQEVTADPRTPTVRVTPQDVRPGWTVNVLATGFPANSELRVLLGIPGERARRTYTVQTDNQGAAYTQVQFPEDADVNRDWVVWVRAPGTQTDALTHLNPTRTGIPITGPTGDIRQQLGSPAWVDTFSTDNNWLISRGFFTDARVEDGQFLITGLTEVDGWRLSWPRVENAYIEMTVNTGECSGGDRYGLFVNVPVDRNAPHTGNLFGVTCNGSYFLRRWDDGSGAWLVLPTRSEHINIGPNQTNRVGILVQGERLSLYANGVLLNEIVDPTYAGEGRFGIFVGARETENFTIAVDEIAYWRVP